MLLNAIEPLASPLQLFRLIHPEDVVTYQDAYLRTPYFQFHLESRAIFYHEINPPKELDVETETPMEACVALFEHYIKSRYFGCFMSKADAIAALGLPLQDLPIAFIHADREVHFTLRWRSALNSDKLVFTRYAYGYGLWYNAVLVQTFPLASPYLGLLEHFTSSGVHSSIERAVRLYLAKESLCLK
jgi:hypothetical protein